MEEQLSRKIAEVDALVESERQLKEDLEAARSALSEQRAATTQRMQTMLQVRIGISNSNGLHICV